MTDAETFRCPACGDRRRGGDANRTWCLNSDCAYVQPRRTAKPAVEADRLHMTQDAVWDGHPHD